MRDGMHGVDESAHDIVRARKPDLADRERSVDDPVVHTRPLANDGLCQLELCRLELCQLELCRLEGNHFVGGASRGRARRHGHSVARSARRVGLLSGREANPGWLLRIVTRGQDVLVTIRVQDVVGEVWAVLLEIHHDQSKGRNEGAVDLASACVRCENGAGPLRVVQS